MTTLTDILGRIDPEKKLKKVREYVELCEDFTEGEAPPRLFSYFALLELAKELETEQQLRFIRGDWETMVCNREHEPVPYKGRCPVCDQMARAEKAEAEVAEWKQKWETVACQKASAELSVEYYKTEVERLNAELKRTRPLTDAEAKAFESWAPQLNLGDRVVELEAEVERLQRALAAGREEWLLACKEIERLQKMLHAVWLGHKKWGIHTADSEEEWLTALARRVEEEA